MSMMAAYRRISIPGLGLALVVSLVASTSGCGGKGKQGADEPGFASDEESSEGEGEGDVLIPPEKMDEVQHFFDRKRSVMARCLVRAMEEGDVDKEATGHVTLTMTISRSGELGNLKIAEIRPRSRVLEECVLDTARPWTVTTLPKPLDFSYTFGFGTL